MRCIAIAWLVCVGLPGVVQAHDLQHRVGRGEAVVIDFFFGDGRPLLFESYEIYPASGQTPVQVGRTDRRGRLSFVPEGTGRWRVKLFTEDGHGADFSFETDAQGEVASGGEGPAQRLPRWVVGVSILFGLFGLISLFVRGRSSA